MLLVDRTSAEIWQMLLPKKNILFPARSEFEDLIFYYRNYLYFVHEDGAVVRMNKPNNVHLLTQEDLWELLFHEKETLDYDDQGIFSIGAILLDMGFLVQLNRNWNRNFRLEIANTLELGDEMRFIELRQASFQYALYYSLIKCHQWNEESAGEYEFEIQRIEEIEEPLERFQT